MFLYFIFCFNLFWIYLFCCFLLYHLFYHCNYLVLCSMFLISVSSLSVKQANRWWAYKCIYSISKQLINTSETITNHWYPCYRGHLLGKLHCGTTQTTPVYRLNITSWPTRNYGLPTSLRLTNATKEQVVAKVVIYAPSNFLIAEK